jgi:hypothetical protein
VDNALGIDAKLNAKLGITPQTQEDAKGELYKWGLKQGAKGEKMEAQHPIPEPKGIAGQVGEQFFKLVGEAPAAVASFAPGLGPEQALIWGMQYEAIQASARAKENGQDNAIALGSEAASYRTLQQWLLSTPRGRVLSAFLWAAGGIGDEIAQNFLNGKTTPLGDLVKTGAVNALLGGIASTGPEKLPPAAKEIYFDAVEQPRKGNYDEAGRLADQTMMLLPDATRKAVGNNILEFRNRAVEARPEDAPMEQPGDRKMLTARPTQGPSVPSGEPIATPYEASGPVIKRPYRTKEEFRPDPYDPEAAKRNKLVPKENLAPDSPLTASTAEPGAHAGPEKTNSGIDWKKQRQRGSSINPAEAIIDLYHQLKEKMGDDFSMEEFYKHASALGHSREDVMKALQGGARQLAVRDQSEQGAPTTTAFNAMTDHFYFGFAGGPKAMADFLVRNMPKAREALKKSPAGKVGTALHEYFSPETMNPTREMAASQIGKEIGRRQVDRHRIPQNWWRKQRLDSQLRFAYEADQRRAFWFQFSKGQMKQMLENWESKRSWTDSKGTAGTITGHMVADRILVYYDHLYKAVSKFDQQNNLRYNIRDSYIPHILKDPADMQKLEENIRRMRWGDPSFMHPRDFDNLQQVHMFGLELKTYNPEDLFQMRWESSLRAREQGRVLLNFHEAGLSFTADDFDKFEGQLLAQARARGITPTKGQIDKIKALREQFEGTIKAQAAEQVRRSPMADPQGKHQTYWVLKDADAMISRALDPYKQGQLAEWGGKALQTIKQRTVGIDLGWSGYHHLHMLTIGASDTIGTNLTRILDGVGTRQNFTQSLTEALTLGVHGHVKSQGAGSRILKYYKGGLDRSDLSPAEAQRLEFYERGGFTPYISHERQIQVMQSALGSVRPEMRHADKALDLAYNIYAGKPYQKWLFGTAIPSMKMFSFDAQVAALTEAHPEILNPMKALEFDKALRKIRNNVDTQFGEQNMRQNFQHPWMKGFGQNMMLSYSWLLSFIGVYGGAFHDLSKGVTHVDEVINTFRREGAGRQPDKSSQIG